MCNNDKDTALTDKCPFAWVILLWGSNDWKKCVKNPYFSASKFFDLTLKLNVWKKFIILVDYSDMF